jgi:zinc/manganese transport system substrate-binding protein
VTASRGVPALKAEGGHSHAHGHGHSHGEHDPHIWQNPALIKTYVANIRDALISADAAGRETYERQAASYTAALDALDAEVKAAISRIPQDRRRILTAHDAFQYFERAYGVDFISPRGVSTEAEPSAQQVARLIRQIRDQRISAVFLENVTDPRLAKRIADETGARIGGTLFSDALSAPDGPAPTYIELIRHNVRQLVTALSPSS